MHKLNPTTDIENFIYQDYCQFILSLRRLKKLLA